MTNHQALIRRGGIVLAVLAGVPLGAAWGWAAEGEASWRATYDLVMMWVNFGILAFLLVKYLRAPLLNLLKDEAHRTGASLKQAQAGREQVDQKVQETVQALEGARERLREIQEKILTEGKRQRQLIIESAQHESRLMFDRANLKIDAQIAEAHLRLRSELIDRAVALAMERLPAEITAEEQLRLLDRFIREAQPS